jgi:hypothetical protein
MDCLEVAGRIQTDYPDARILVMLRNPFDRAFSHLLHDAQNVYGAISDLNAAQIQALAEADDKYIRRSCYAACLKPFFDCFPREQIGIFFYDSVRSQPDRLVADVYQFVGVDAQFVPEGLTRRINKTQDYRSMTAYRLLRGASVLAKSFPPTRAMMEWLFRSTSLRERTLDLLMVDGGRPELQARDVLTAQQLQRISDDYSRLVHELKVCVPDSWPAVDSDNSTQQSQISQPTLHCSAA